MIVREKRSGEEFSYPLELELDADFSPPGPEWELEEDADKPLSMRNTKTGEVRYPPPNAQWRIHVPELLETDEMPTRNLVRRHTGNWNHVRPGDDTDYEFIPENDDERQTLKKYGFTITEK
jgi:hypothetical protein